MKRSDIAAVIKKIPELTDFGIGLPKTSPKADRVQELAKQQERLLKKEAICTKVCEWLLPIHLTKSINRKHTSYGLKYMAERAIGEDVSNGVFIAAAVHSGFPYKLIPNASEVWFGISEKSLKPYLPERC